MIIAQELNYGIQICLFIRIILVSVVMEFIVPHKFPIDFYYFLARKVGDVFMRHPVN